MIIASASNISKSYGVETILENISFHINENDRIGLVGMNGAGKTTLFKILTGTIPFDDGELFISNNLSIGYLKQNHMFASSNTIYSEMLSVFSDLIELENEIRNLEKDIASISSEEDNTKKLLDIYAHKMEIFNEKNGYGYKSEIRGVLSGLGFGQAYFDQSISNLSGGEKTRLSLAKLLLNKPSLLLLDEPTNHLDMDALQWLEQYLKSYKGTVLLISHDRYFLDQTVNRIFEIEKKVLNVYEGNYSLFLKKKQDGKLHALRQFEKQQKEIKKQEEMIRRFKQHGTEKLAKRAKSREHLLEHIDILEKPTMTSDKMKVKFKPKIQSGRDVLFAEYLSKSYESKCLFKNVSFDIKKGEKVCIVGPNGIGKTTLLKMILSTVKPDSGSIRLGHNVFMDYFDQEQKLLNDDNTVIEEIHNEHMAYTATEVRSILGRFMFKNDDVFKEISVLSGGERSRLSLLKLMLSNANFLIMDEPTNHLDIESKEIFEEALLQYEGTLFIVSHDRFFLNKIPDRIMELTEEGINEYLGNYDYYLEKKKEQEENQEIIETIEYTKTKRKENNKKEKERLMASKKRKKDMLDMEKEISNAEERLVAIQHEMCKPEIYSNPEHTRQLNLETITLKQSLEKLYEAWESMVLLLEEDC